MDQDDLLCSRCFRPRVTRAEQDRLRSHAHVCDCTECSALCWSRIEHDREWECDGRVVDWKARVQTLERELERWRHRVTIEGDYVCPDSIQLINAMALAKSLAKALRGIMRGVGHLPRPEVDDAISALAAYRNFKR